MRVPYYWRNLPPGAETATEDCKNAKAMVVYLPYVDTAYDVSRRLSGTIEVCFGRLEDARRFFDAAVESGDVETAELRQDRKGHPRGILIDEFTDGARS